MTKFHLSPGVTIKEYHIQDTYLVSRPENNVLMMGGGLDSYIVLLTMLENNVPRIRPVFVNYGQLSALPEEEACRKQCEKHGLRLITFYDDSSVIKRLNPYCKLFDDMDENPEAYARNLFMLMVGAGFGDSVWLGLDKPMDGKKPFFDCTESYINMAVTLIGKPNLLVYTPFLNMDKGEAVNYGLNRDPELFDITFSCWTPIEGNSCGVCDKCVKTKRLRGVTDEMMGG
jgi:7-cyano-7-deazaguanine synthase in queuosine biosynthesis